VRKILVIALLGVFSLAALVMPTGANPVASADSVPNPTVTGPIPANVPPGDPSHDYTFFTTDLDLASKGYVEEEYFIEGTANRYNIPAAVLPPMVPFTDPTVISSGHEYKTRIVVRRPISPWRFNGTVLLEWQNVTAGYELDAMWIPLAEHITRSGYAWVGVSAQYVGVHGFPPPLLNQGLKAWSPTRYGSLDLTGGYTIPVDSMSYDIYSQAAQAVRSPDGIDPMGGLNVKRVFALGASQSAMYLTNYYNAIQPLAGVIDAFDFAVSGGPFREDLGVKKFRYLSETDLIALDQIARRAPDSNELRSWEVAGAAHFDYYSQLGTQPIGARDGIVAAPVSCVYPPYSRIPFYQVGRAVIDNLVRWVKYGIPPASAPPIELDMTPPDPIARDSYGNALGGIRLSQHDVPTATNTGLNLPPYPQSFCIFFGTHIPFDEATLAALYPSHIKYALEVTKVTTKNLLRGYIVWQDALATIEEAWQADIP